MGTIEGLSAAAATATTNAEHGVVTNENAATGAQQVGLREQRHRLISESSLTPTYYRAADI